MSQFTENSRINITTNNKEESEEDEDEHSKPKVKAEIKSNSKKKEALEVLSIINAIAELKTKENFQEALKKINSPALFLRFVFNLIHSSKNEVRYDYEALSENDYKCDNDCVGHLGFFTKAERLIVNF